MPEHIKRKLQEEIETLEYELSHDLPKELKKAVALGDLSENAEYHMAKQRQEYVRARLGQLKKRMADLSLINMNNIPKDKAGLGSKVKVYDSTKKAGIARTVEHLILLEPGADRLRISETFVLGNDSNLTYNDPAKGSIQFFLPPATDGNAQVIITAPGGMPIPRPAEKTATAGIYKVDYPVKPGETRMDVSYTLPATNKFSGKVVASDAATHLVTPGTVTVTGDGIELAGREPQTQANIYNLTGLDYNLLIDGIGSLRQDDSAGAGAQGDDGGSPQVEIKKPRIYGQLPWVLSLAFAILALGGTMLYRRGTA